MSSEGYIYLAMFLFGLVVGSLCLAGWFWQKRIRYRSGDYYSNRNLGLWEHIKFNILLMACVFFYVISISGFFMLVTK